MATANESRFYASLKETQDAIDKLASVLNVLSPPSEASRQLARQRLGDLKIDAATYLDGNKAKAVIAKLMNASELWDFLKAKNESQNTISKRVLRYLVEVQTILGIPEGQIPAITQEEAKKVAPIVEKAKEVKDQVKREEKSGMKLSGGTIAAVGAGVIGLLWFLKRKK